MNSERVKEKDKEKEGSGKEADVGGRQRERKCQRG